MTYNKKSIGPVISFILWTLGLLTVCIVGISNVFAAEYTFSYNDTQTYYDNLGSSVTYVNSSWNESLQAYVSDNINTTANSYGAGVSINAPIPILENHTYTLTLAFPDLSNIALSSKNYIALSISALGAANNYAAGNYYADMQYSTNQSNKILQFVFKATGNASYIFIPWTTTYTTTQSYFLNKIIIEDLGSEGVSQDQINISLGNQTSQIQDSLNNTENNIKNEIKNTEDNIKDSIKDGFESCRDSYNLFSYSLFDMSQTYGLILLDKTKSYTLAVKLKEGKSIPTGIYFGFTDKSWTASTDPPKRFDILNSGNFIGSPNSDGWYIKNIDSNSVYNYVFIFPKNINIEDYFYVMLNEGNILKPYEKYGEKICSNRIDDTNDKLDDVNKSLNDDSIDSSSANSFFDSFSSTDHGGISGIITAPLVAIKKMLDKNCSPLSATYKGKKIELPCGYDFWSKMTAIKEFINLTLGGLLCYNIIRKLFKLIESMKNPDDDRVEVMKL